VARTLFDLAGVLRADQLERTIEAADRHGAFDLRALQRGPMPRALREVLADYHGSGFVRSELERRFARLIRDAGLAAPAMNFWICGQEVDAVWEDQKLVVQLDGYEFHRTRAAFERDRRRDAALQLARYRLLRITYRWLGDDPDGVVTAVRSLLDNSSSSATEASTSSPNSSRSAIAS
jgi:very-short-patch-repair endonuclease